MAETIGPCGTGNINQSRRVRKVGSKTNSRNRPKKKSNGKRKRSK